MTSTTVPNSLWWRILNLPARLWRQIGQYGVTGLLKRMKYRWRCNQREKRLGIRTSGSIHGTDLGNGAEQNLGYQPIPFESFDRAIGQVDLSSGEEVFIDYGCGMGRAVVLAGLLPFRRVMGVELSAELAAIARENLNKCRHELRCDDAEIFTADATQFDLPADVTVVFMFNPFCGEILTTVLERIHRSLQQHPRSCVFIYAHPRDNGNMLESCSWLTRREELRMPNEPWQRLVIYDYVI